MLPRLRMLFDRRVLAASYFLCRSRAPRALRNCNSPVAHLPALKFAARLRKAARSSPGRVNREQLWYRFFRGTAPLAIRSTFPGDSALSEAAPMLRSDHGV